MIYRCTCLRVSSFCKISLWSWFALGQLTIDFQLVTHSYHVELSLALIIFPRNHHDGPHVPRSNCGCPIGLVLWRQILFFGRYSVLIQLFELFSQRIHPLVSPLLLKIEKDFLSSASNVYTDESNQMVPSHLLRNWIFSSQISWLETTSLISLGTNKHQEKRVHGGGNEQFILKLFCLELFMLIFSVGKKALNFIKARKIWQVNIHIQ